MNAHYKPLDLEPVGYWADAIRSGHFRYLEALGCEIDVCTAVSE